MSAPIWAADRDRRSSSNASGGTISRFYDEYHGHTVSHLDTLVGMLPNGRSVMYLMGDSTLDNKYWLGRQTLPACNGYERCLAPPRSPADVAFCLNAECVQRGLGDSYCCVNAAVEESTLGLRDGGKLLPQDAFVRRQLCEKDVLIVSMGGNDIALRPTLGTIVSMVLLLASPRWMIEWGIAPGLGHFVSLFRDSTRKFLEHVTAERKPLCVAACMLYYLDEQPGGSWADFTLQKLGYNTDPSKLQLIMREVYTRGVSKIALKGVRVVPVPLYEALDGKDSADYVQRVEPSAQGGRKLAQRIMDALEPVLRADAAGGAVDRAAAAVQSTDHGKPAATADLYVSMPKSVHNQPSS